MALKFYKTHSYSLPIKDQVWAMEAFHPQFRVERWRGKNITWAGNITPTTSSESYTIRIIYQLGLPPHVFVLSPALRDGGDGTPTPHTFSGKRLCLYFPEAKEWDSSMAIGKTIVPWTSLWLYFYEVWLATGQWEGGGCHPQGGPKKEGTEV